jgi:hypothetical protein
VGDGSFAPTALTSSASDGYDAPLSLQPDPGESIENRGKSMTSHIIDQIPFQINLKELIKTVRVKETSPMLDDLKKMAEEAQVIAAPKVLYRVALVEKEGDRNVSIDGTGFTSRVLRVNLDKAHRVFPFVATCGLELKEWAVACEDMLARFWADAIMEQALFTALQFFQEHLQQRYQPGALSSMNPGSLEDWPITQQRLLFDLLGEPLAQVGVQLTESMLMIPAKSVSGILFPTDQTFASCQLCPREGCPNRRAEYDADLFQEKYQVQDVNPK